ncbi:PWI domain-containing protein [Aspergillus tanneri]|uniref:Serine/arginine repetitive matrix protein 1 n=1 Tax=Aspergillus tanneri TaxID=1220188 RepID=A0A5M9MG35_9EURO|nr:Serine/arginine repetitive matrix protein 1 [Aspergillus tanneri]KAA8645918.1 Serine/arginine repetitive matrix protein 1 [Aspergillus tanneri]
MQVAEILSDLTSLRVCDHHDALAMVTVNERVAASRLTSEVPADADVDSDRTLPQQRSERTAREDLRRAKEIVELHHGFKLRHVDGRVDEELSRARDWVDHATLKLSPSKPGRQFYRAPGGVMCHLRCLAAIRTIQTRNCSFTRLDSCRNSPPPAPPLFLPGLARMANNVDAKLLKQTKFPPEFNRKVDMTKVNIEVMKKWIAGKISEILGNEDDVVIELCFNLLEGSRFPDIKSLQIQLTGFLDKDTARFCKELWSLCLSAQENAQGVPKELLEAKKLELIQEKIEAERAAEEARRQKEQERARERELEQLRRRERNERPRGGRRGGGRGGRDFDRRRSPPRRHSRDRFRDLPSRREFDSSSRSRSRGSQDRDARRRRSSPHSSRADKRESTANFAKARKSRDDHRLSRSRERDNHGRRRHSRSRSLSRGRSRSDSFSPRRRDSRSRSNSHGRDRKRRRSIERYAPAARRRRNTSSLSIRGDKRQRMTDQEDARGSSPPPGKPSSTNRNKDTEEIVPSSTRPRARIPSTEIREKLLREKLVAMRRTTNDH